jgi:hypothetical protein
VSSSHYQEYFADPERMGLFRSRWLMERMPGKTMVHGAAIGPHAVAVTDSGLDGRGMVTVDLGKTPVVIVRGGDGGVRAFRAQTGARRLSLAMGDGTLVDGDSGSSWNLETGVASDGEGSGEALDPVPVTTAFWFAWSSFYPNTKVVDRAPSPEG